MLQFFIINAMIIMVKERADTQPDSGQKQPRNCIAWSCTGREN